MGQKGRLQNPDTLKPIDGVINSDKGVWSEKRKNKDLPFTCNILTIVPIKKLAINNFKEQYCLIHMSVLHLFDAFLGQVR